MSQFNVIDQSIRGNISILDPKSKLIISFLMILGVSISIEIYQVFLFTILLIPTVFLYRPNPNVIRRILVFLPLMIVISLFLFISLKDNVSINFFGFRKTYTPFQFIIITAFRFFVSVAHSSILLESEVHKSDLIDALASFRFSRPLVSMLLLINRMVNRLQDDYVKMMLAAKTKGINTYGGINVIFFKLRIMSRLLTRSTRYSETIGFTLIARGFQGNFTPTVRGFTSEGISTVIIAFTFFLLVALFPLWS